ISALALGTVVLIFVSVNRPVTKSGRISNVTPFPFDVEMSAVKFVNVVPPTKFPLPNVVAHAGLLVVPLQIAHEAEVPVALKLPLAWAWARAGTTKVQARINSNFFIFAPCPLRDQRYVSGSLRRLGGPGDSGFASSPETSRELRSSLTHPSSKE